MNNIPTMLKSYLKRFYDFCLRNGIYALHEFNQMQQYQKWLIIVSIIWIFTLPIIFCIQLEDDFTKYPQTLYLLSALAQSLAAIFALVFTISLVAAQLFSRYSHRMLANIFDRVTIGYICIFILAIMLCLFSINKVQDHDIVKISLSAGSLSLLLLIPYFLRFKKLLNPEYTIKKLRVAAEKTIEEDPTIVPDEITKIDNFVMSALVLKDYDTFNAGIRSLESLVKIIVLENDKIGEPERPLFETIFNNLTGKLRDIAISGIDDPRTPFVVIDSLKRIGVTSANQKIDSYSMSICEILGDIGSRADQNGLTAIIKESTGLLAAFRYICNTALKNGLENTLLVSSAKIKNVAVDATKSKSPEIVESAVEQLRDYTLESLSIDFRTSVGVNMGTNITNHIKDIGMGCIENTMHDTTISIARSLAVIAEKALGGKIEDTVVMVLNALGLLSHKACESRFASTSESIAEWLYKVGLSSISNSFHDANRLVAESLMSTVLDARRFELWSTYNKSLDYLIELGVEATLKANNYAQNIFAEKLGYMSVKPNVLEVDIRFDAVQSKHEGQEDYLTKFAEFKELYRKKKEQYEVVRQKFKYPF